MITIDTSELTKLSQGMAQYKSIMPKSVASQALKKSIRPMFRSAQRLAPVGKYERDAERGKITMAGTTRRDIRIKSVPAKGNENARMIVGVSKMRGKAGWYTVFRTRGFTDRGGRFHRGDNFLQNAFDYTIEIVRDNFKKEVLISFQRWAKRNLPQGRF